MVYCEQGIRIKKLSLAILFIMFTLSALCQRNKPLSITKLNEDLAVLKDALYKSHPGVFKYTSRETLDNLFDSLTFYETDQLNTIELEKRVRVILDEVKCIHTSVQKSVLDNNYPIIPFKFFTDGENLWIKDQLNDTTKTHLGAKVLAINENQTKDILSQMSSYYPSDGYNKTFKYKFISNNLTFSKLYNYYFDNDSIKQFLLINSTNDTIDLKVNNIKYNPPKTKSQRKLKKAGKYNYFSIDSSYKLATLKVESFAKPKLHAFDDYRKIFRLLEKNEVENLIIDLRGNLGGNAYNSNLFLGYFLDEDFVYYDEKRKSKIYKSLCPFSKSMYLLDHTASLMIPSKRKIKTDSTEITQTFKIKKKEKFHYEGQIYVLTDGFTVSAGSTVASALKYKRNATIIGQETGGGEAEFNGCFTPRIKLPNSKIKIGIPQYHLYLNLTEDKGTGVIPDIEIRYSIDDIIENRDLEMEAVFNKIF